MTLSLGQRLNVAINDIAFGGEGVARVEDFVVFVPFVAPGETVAVEVVEVKKRFARARLLEVLSPSPERVTPQCPYFGTCGGCQYQHLAYDAQLKIKHKQIADLLQRVGSLGSPAIDPVVPCPQPYGYRNRIMVRSQWDKPRQALNLGFIRYDNRLVVDIECCPISEPGINEQLQYWRAHPPPKGGLKTVLRLPVPGWEVPHDSFFQNNFFMLPGLVDVARQRIADSGVRFLIDVYCGVGFFSLELADLVERYVGIELDKRAIVAARRNALQRNRPNGEFVVGTAEALLPGILSQFPPEQTAVILDPPRTGCPKEILEELRQLGLAQVLYISCHPATLARDLSLLTADGRFELKRVTPLDMFPQTQHVECAADLRLAGPASEPPPICQTNFEP